MEPQFTARQLAEVFGLKTDMVHKRQKIACVSLKAKTSRGVTTHFSFADALAMTVHDSLMAEGLSLSAAAKITRPIARHIPDCRADDAFSPYVIFLPNGDHFSTDNRSLAHTIAEWAADGNGRAVVVNVRSTLQRAAERLSAALEKELAA